MMTRILLVLVPILLPLAGFAQNADGEFSRDKKELTLDGKIYAIETKKTVSSEPGTRYYLAEQGGYAFGVFGVHIPESYAGKSPLPLIVNSHGKGGNGAAGIGEWAGYSERYGLVVVCPSFGYATGRSTAGADDQMLSEIMERILSSLKIDRRYVLGTGFSGGGLVVFGCMMQHPEWFTALCFRSANYRGTLTRKSKWDKVPVYVLWGEKDNPIIFSPPDAGQGPAVLNALLDMKGLSREYSKRTDRYSFEKDGSFRWDMIKGGGHNGRADLVTAWFAKKVVRSAVPTGPAVTNEETKDPGFVPIDQFKNL